MMCSAYAEQDVQFASLRHEVTRHHFGAKRSSIIATVGSSIIDSFIVV